MSGKAAGVRRSRDEPSLPSSSARSVKRRWRAVFVLCLAALLSLVALAGRHHETFRRRLFDKSCRWTRQAALLTIEERVNKILGKTPLIGIPSLLPDLKSRPDNVADGHNDLPILIRALAQNHIYSDNFTKGFETEGLPMHVDLPRLKAGKVGGTFWSVYVGCPVNGSDLTDVNYAISPFALGCRETAAAN